MYRRSVPSVLLGLTALVAGCQEGSADHVPAAEGVRTVTVDMVDIAFEPAGLEVAAGETIRFVFRNRGAIPHDAFIGDETAQSEHGAQMNAAGGGHGEHGHHGAGAVHVAPGETAELTHTFTEAGETIIGCHQPGHYEAGMRLTISVA